MTHLPLYALALLLTLYAWCIVSRVFHEVVRGITARFVGYASRTVTFGIGNVWFQHRVGRTQVEWTPAPILSQATLHLPSPRGLVWRWSTCILVAVAMDLVLLAAMLAGKDALQAAYPVLPMWTLPLLCLPYAQLFVTLANLMPVEIPGDTGQEPAFYSDGNLLLALLWGQFSEVPHMMVARYEQTVQTYDPLFKKEDSPLLKHLPPAIWRRLLEVHLDEASGDHDSVVWHCKRLLHTVDFAPGERARLLDVIASIPVFHDAPALHHRALRLARQAFELFPKSARLHLTLGCLLVQDGNYTEGVRLLEPIATHPTFTSAQRAIAASHLALACHALDDFFETRYWLSCAEENAIDEPTKATVQRLTKRVRSHLETKP